MQCRLVSIHYIAKACLKNPDIFAFSCHLYRLQVFPVKLASRSPSLEAGPSTEKVGVAFQKRRDT